MGETAPEIVELQIRVAHLEHCINVLAERLGGEGHGYFPRSDDVVREVLAAHAPETE